MPTPPRIEILPDRPKRPSLAVRKRDEKVRRLVRRVRTLAPHLEHPAFGPVLQSFSRISLLLLNAYERLRDQDLIGPDGELRSSIDVIRKLALAQTRMAESLGLTPNTFKEANREKSAMDMLDAASERIARLLPDRGQSDEEEQS